MQTAPKPPFRPEKVASQENHASEVKPEESKLQVMERQKFRSKDSNLADGAFRILVVGCALALVAIVGLVLFELISQSRLAVGKFGFKFLITTIWDPVEENFGALTFIYGTIVSSVLAIIIAVPLSLGTALFLTEICPRP